jgi:hypothetical protein
MVEMTIEDYGGVDNPNFRREHLCELVADSSLRLTPEFHKGQIKDSILPLTDNFGSSVTFKPYIGGDIGLTDNTALIFGYYDHLRNKYIVKSEWVENYKSFSVIVDAYNEGMKYYKDFLDPVTVVDIWDVARHSLNVDYNWITQRPTKGRVEETILNLRNVLENDVIEIDSSCKHLIFELENAVWKTNKKDIDRNSEQSHGDALMALAYIVKEIPFGRKPSDKIPFKFGLGRRS